MTSMCSVLIQTLVLGLINEIATSKASSDCSTNFPGGTSCDPYHDGAAFLQAMQSRSQQTLGADQADFEVLSATGKTVKAGCDVSLLNAGACTGDEVCVGCELTGTSADLPQASFFFPNFELRCQGNRTCSQNLSSDPFNFRSAGQVMVCIGDETCKDIWNITNVGAVCCSSTNDGDTCSGSKFTLTTDDVICQNDVCCDGTRVCTNSTMDEVESLLCRGLFACSDSKVTLEQDLYCNATSESNPSSSGSTCSDSTFTFVVSDTHVVDCLGDSVCEDSTFNFNQDSSVFFECDSEAAGAGGGQGACNTATINLAPGVCMELKCTQDDDCNNMVVNLFGGECYFNMFNQETRPNFVAVCDKVNLSVAGTYPCGPTPPQEICCRDDLSCGSCCADITTSTQTPPPDISTTTTVTTTEATTTTSTKKKYPYHRRNRRNRREHRRNRRQNRRNRRQHSRQYRYY